MKTASELREIAHDVKFTFDPSIYEKMEKAAKEGKTEVTIYRRLKDHERNELESLGYVLHEFTARYNEIETKISWQ